MRPRARFPSSPLALALALAAASLLLADASQAARRRVTSVIVDLPTDGYLNDESLVVGSARIGNNFDPLTVEVRINGVDLLAALALTPPFFGAGGNVTIGPDVVAISNFDFELAPNKMKIDFDATGLSLGDHDLTIEAERIADSMLISDTADFRLLAGFTEEARVIATTGLPDGPIAVFGGGSIANATLGQPIAGPPIPLSGGGELRSGFVEAAEARIAGP